MPIARKQFPMTRGPYLAGMVQWGQSLSTPIPNAVTAMVQAVVDQDPGTPSNYVFNDPYWTTKADALVTSWMTMATTPSPAGSQAFGLGYTGAQAASAIATIRANALALQASF